MTGPYVKQPTNFAKISASERWRYVKLAMHDSFPACGCCNGVIRHKTWHSRSVGITRALPPRWAGKIGRDQNLIEQIVCLFNRTTARPSLFERVSFFSAAGLLFWNSLDIYMLRWWVLGGSTTRMASGGLSPGFHSPGCRLLKVEGKNPTTRCNYHQLRERSPPCFFFTLFVQLRKKLFIS